MGLPATKSYEYERRRPEETPLYEILRTELNTFVSEREIENRSLPDYVTEEFEEFLRCGLPQYGFLRLKCTGCKAEKIVAFSCKKRGFCPSCAGKRMAESAAHLVDNVLPHVPYRQFVISYPFPLRFYMNASRELCSKVLRIISTSIHRYYTKTAEKNGIKNSAAGSISFLQRFGSDLRLNPHHHILVPEGVYILVGDKPVFKKAPKITDEDVEKLLMEISAKIRKYLVKKGYLNADGEICLNPEVSSVFSENEAVSMAAESSFRNRIAFGENAGKYVTKIGSGFGYEEEIPVAKSRLCRTMQGFSLHCATAVKTSDRRGLERLVSYMARGPLANERVTLTDLGKVKLKLKKNYSDGTSHLLFTKSEFIERLVALIPPPRTHLVRWSGFFAPNSPLRKAVTLKPKIKKGFQFKSCSHDTEDGEEGEGGSKEKSLRSSPWARMLERVFKIDVAKCDRCDGTLKPVAAVTCPGGIRSYLTHMGLDPDPPSRDPPRHRQSSFEFSTYELDCFPLPLASDLPSLSYD